MNKKLRFFVVGLLFCCNVQAMFHNSTRKVVQGCSHSFQKRSFLTNSSGELSPWRFGFFVTTVVTVVNIATEVQEGLEVNQKNYKLTQELVAKITVENELLKKQLEDKKS